MMSMRRRLTVLFLLMSLLMLWYAIWLQDLYWILLWPMLSFFLVGLAYGGIGPALFAKQKNGALPLRTWVLLGPYLLLSWVGWLGLRAAQGKAPWNEVAPGIFLGRRLEEHELPDEISIIVDMTCEFSTRHPVRSNRRYLCLPTLDATAPEPTAFSALIDELREARGNIFIHCAAGHGRSATVAAVLLLVREVAKTPAESEERLQQSRPKVKLNPEQRALLNDFARSHDESTQ
jgi:protein-tyrosine phosphatase